MIRIKMYKIYIFILPTKYSEYELCKNHLPCLLLGDKVFLILSNQKQKDERVSFQCPVEQAGDPSPADEI